MELPLRYAVKQEEKGKHRRSCIVECYFVFFLSMQIFGYTHRRIPLAWEWAAFASIEGNREPALFSLHIFWHYSLALLFLLHSEFFFSLFAESKGLFHCGVHASRCIGFSPRSTVCRACGLQ